MDIFSHSGDIRGQSRKWSKIDRNFACFAWPQIFFGGSAPEFLEWDYKIQPDSDHVAKFQGDRSRELGERVVKRKKEDTSAVKHKPVRNGGSGRPNNNLAPFWRYGGLKVENRQFVPTPPSFNALARGDPFKFWDEHDISRN